MANGIVLNIDTTKSEFQNPMVQLRQGDGNYQSLDVKVTSNGEPLDLTGWTTTFMGTTASGFKVVDSAVMVTNALQGEFTYTPTKAWGQDQGEFKNAYFSFVKSDQSASSAAFRVNVLDAVDLTAEEAGNYISIVDQTIKQLNSDVSGLVSSVNDLKSQNLSIKTSNNTWTGTNTFNTPIVGSVTGSANKLQTPRMINGTPFDGTSDITITGSGALAVGGVYPTIADLITANPDHSRTYITTDNGNWNYWNITNSAWQSGGVYQATAVSDNSITYKQAAKNIINFRAYSYSKIPDYNSTTKQLTFNSDVIVEIGNGNIDSINRFTIKSGTVVTNTVTSGAFFKVLFNTVDGSVNIVGQKDNVDSTYIPLVTFSGTGAVSGVLPITYNNSFVNSTKDIPYLNMISGGDPTDGLYKGIVLRVDVANKTLIIPKFSSTLVLRDDSGNRFSITDTVTVDITPAFSSPFSGYVVYDRTTNLFSYKNYDYAFKGNVDSIIASVRYINSKLHVYSNLNNLTIDGSDMFNGLSKQVLLPNSGSQQIYTSLPLNETVDKYPNFVPTQRKITYPKNTAFYTANGKVSYIASNLTIDLSYDSSLESTITKDYASGAILFNQLKTRFEFWVDHLPSDLTGYYIHSWVSYNWKAPDYGTWQTTTPYLTEGTLIRNPLKSELVSLIKQNASSDDASLPDYYTDYITSKYNEINTLMESITDGDAFIFITDTHWGDNVQVSPNIINHIKKNTNVQKVIFGGDVVRAFGTKDKIKEDVYGFNSEVKDYIDSRNYFPTIGNHDFTIKFERSADDQTGYTYGVPFAYNSSVKPLESYVSLVNKKMYYYFDNPVQKVRYIMVNTEEEVNSGDNPWGVGAHITQQQLDWLTNDALNVPSDDWHVVTIGHVPIHPYAPSHDGALDILRYALEGYTNKSKASFTAPYGTVLNTDFSAYKGKMVGYFCGHNHKDTEFVGTNMVNISTGCDAHYNDDVWTRTAGTVTEQLFDVVIVDKTNKKINMVRVGAGENRNYLYQ